MRNVEIKIAFSGYSKTWEVSVRFDSVPIDYKTGLESWEQAFDAGRELAAPHLRNIDARDDVECGLC